MSSRTRSSSSPWLGVGVLSLAVAASSFTVPGFLNQPRPDENPSRAAAPGATPEEATTTPIATPSAVATTPSAIVDSEPAVTVSPTPRPTTPVPTTTTKKPRPRPRPTFEALTVNPWAKSHESSGIEVIDCPLCVSGRRVQYLGQGHYVIVRLKDVKVPGRRTMTIIYTCACADEPRELDVMVNSDPVRTFPLTGAGSWDTPARTTMKLNLLKGENVIRFFNQEAPAPDLDQILIR